MEIAPEINIPLSTDRYFQCAAVTGGLDLSYRRQRHGSALADPVQSDHRKRDHVCYFPQLKLIALDAATGKQIWTYIPFDTISG